jgi:hypothetical protein
MLVELFTGEFAIQKVCADYRRYLQGTIKKGGLVAAPIIPELIKIIL